MKRATGILFLVLVVAVLAAIAVHAKGVLPSMVYRYGLTNEQFDDIFAAHPQAELRITAQDWRAMRYQLHRFASMTNYVRIIGDKTDCERTLLSLDDSVRNLRAATNSLAVAAAVREALDAKRIARLELDYASATNAYWEAVEDFRGVLRNQLAEYATATNSLAVATNSLAVANAKAARADALKAWLAEQRDKALLSSTKAIYQAIIDRLEGNQ